MQSVGKPLVVCASVHHGNTSRVADAMACVLGAEVVAPANCPYERLTGRPMLGIGSGIYYGRVHEDLRRWLQNLPADRVRGLPAFLFTTSGLPALAWLWHRESRAALAAKGCDIVGEFACGGFDTWGPLWLGGGLNRRHPDERDLVRARAFATAIAARVGAGVT